MCENFDANLPLKLPAEPMPYIEMIEPAVVTLKMQFFYEIGGQEIKHQADKTQLI